MRAATASTLPGPDGVRPSSRRSSAAARWSVKILSRLSCRGSTRCARTCCARTDRSATTAAYSRVGATTTLCRYMATSLRDCPGSCCSGVGLSWLEPHGSEEPQGLDGVVVRRWRGVRVHLEVQVGTAGVAGGPDPGDDLAGGDALYGVDGQADGVAVAGDDPAAVIDVDAQSTAGDVKSTRPVAERAGAARVQDGARGCGVDRRAGIGHQVHPGVQPPPPHPERAADRVGAGRQPQQPAADGAAAAVLDDAAPGGDHVNDVCGLRLPFLVS